jgi:hypothetical protein
MPRCKRDGGVMTKRRQFGLPREGRSPRVTLTA